MFYIKSIVLLLIILFIIGCSKCGDIPVNDVEVRIENSSGINLHRVTFGSTMYKGTNSFASCSLVTRIKELLDGEVSKYFTTEGNHLGYDRVRITWKEPEGHVTSRPTSSSDFDLELIRNGAVEDSIANIYTGKMEVGLRLPAGEYTFKLIGLSNSGNTVEVEINRD